MVLQTLTECYHQKFSLGKSIHNQRILMMVVGGFMIGLARVMLADVRGHAISGLSNLQVPSLIATCCFS
jgi:hypothetical protein